MTKFIVKPRKSALELIAALMTCAFAFCAGAEDELGPMAGTGGVMRDAERRALGPVASGESDAPVPDLKPADAQQPSQIDRLRAKVLGPIVDVEVLGSVEFAERVGLKVQLLEELGDGTDKTMADVMNAIVKVRQKLIGDGYYLARIMLTGADTYDLASRTLSVRIEEGRFGGINVKFDDGSEDGTWFSRRQIYKRFKNIEEGDSFDYSRLRGALFEANAHPDLTIDTSIDIRRPMPVEGEGRDRRMVRYADLDLTVRESMPLHLLWEVNNYGMEEVEEWQTTLTAQYLNLTKHDDVLTVSPSTSFGGELKSIAGSYMLPHEWWRGGNTTIYGGYSKLDVDNIVTRLDLEGTGWFMGLQHSENIINNDNHHLAASIGLLWRYMEDQYTANKLKLNERGAAIFPLSLALSYTAKKPDGLGGRNFATVQFIYNFATSGDDLDEIWTDADDKYAILRWQLARLQPVFGWWDTSSEQYLHQWMLFTKLEGQFTNDNLIPVEKLSLGGYNCLRGYHARGYLGDWGVYGTTELRTPILVDSISSLFSDRTDKKPVDRMQFLGFCDYGYVKYNDLPSGYDDDEFLASIGIGARFALTKYSQLRCDLAFPIVNGDNDDDDDCEVYFSYQMQF